MNRNAAILVGCVSTFLFVFIGLSLAYMALGTEAAFQPESFKPSGSWISGALAAGLVAGALGAIIAGLMAPGTTAPLVLADVVLVLGFILCVAALVAGSSEPVARVGDLPVLEALRQAKLPAWVAILGPLVAKVGVYLGAWPVGAYATTNG